MNKQTEELKLSLNKAFQLGQRYWSWADSEYSSHWKKADAAKAEFDQLVQDTINAALAEQPAQQEPTVEDNSQNWRGMDGTTAYWLIQRHADGWPDIGKMMGEWLEANQAQPAQQQEPVAIVDANDEGYWAEVLPDRSVKVGQPLYTSPPSQRKPLTDEEIYDMYNEPRSDAEMLEFARAIEAAHQIGVKK